jgi:transketolase
MDETECSKVLDPLLERWRDFGWASTEIDGHDMTEICDALDWADGQKRRPSVIIAHTVKGKGVSFMEGQPQFHNAALNEGQFKQALGELETALARAEE